MIRFLIVLAICVSRASAQFSDGAGQAIVRGQILSDRSMPASYYVELHSTSPYTYSLQALTNAMGDFRIEGVSVGDYQLIVADREGHPLHQQFLHVDKMGMPIEVRLAPKTDATPPSGAISVASLSHKIPRGARHEYQAAVAARKHGDMEGSLAHLEKAVTIDPQFAEAHNDLGASYIDRKRYDRALEELDIAARLDPAAAMVELNRAACLSKMGRLVEAETAARRSLRLDATSSRARYALGIILANHEPYTPEAVADLVQASDQFPAARLTAAQVLLKNGHTAEAREQLRGYLNRCSRDCRQVQGWLDRLNASVQP